MKRGAVRLNLALLGLAALWGWLLFDNRSRFEAERRPQPSGPGPAAAPASPRPLSPASASDAAAVAEHHLFHPDRHNDLPEEDPEPPPAASARLPVLMGTLGIGGEDYALMVSGDAGGSDSLYRRLKVGQTLDGYTLVRVEMDRVVMRSGGAEVGIGINDKPVQASARRRDPPRRTSTSRRPTAVGSRSRKRAASTRPAPRPTNVPVGTVRDGKRLIAIPTPFGDIKRWVEDKPK